MKEIAFSIGGLLIFLTVILMVNYFLRMKSFGFDNKKYINFLVYLLFIEMLLLGISQIIL
jgi:hypothetical protein